MGNACFKNLFLKVNIVFFQITSKYLIEFKYAEIQMYVWLVNQSINRNCISIQEQ